MAITGSNKKRAKGRSNSVDNRPKRVASPERKWFQNEWRKVCLSDRWETGRFTEKNQKEAVSLGLVLEH